MLTFVALGGEGKTALVAKWAIGLVGARTGRRFEAAFAWSFYSQGTREQVGASSDLFLAEALKFFGGAAIEGARAATTRASGSRRSIGDKRALLDPRRAGAAAISADLAAAGPVEGRRPARAAEGPRAAQRGPLPRHDALRHREPEGYGATAPQRDLAPLTKDAGARLLEALGVKGTVKEREKLADKVKGHALTLRSDRLAISATPTAATSARRDLIKFEKADAEDPERPRVPRDGRLCRAGSKRAARRARARWRCCGSLGLFDRPADAGCLSALWRRAGHRGPDRAARASRETRIATSVAAAARRREAASPSRATRAARSSAIDAHPLLREYFAKQLRETRPESWKAAHRRLYEHLTTTTKDKDAPTLDDLQPLYQAVAHGCWAGLHQEACDKVYIDRINRGTAPADPTASRNSALSARTSAPSLVFSTRRGESVSPNLDAGGSGVAAEPSRVLACARSGGLAEAREPSAGGARNGRGAGELEKRRLSAPATLVNSN